MFGLNDKVDDMPVGEDIEKKCMSEVWL